MRVVDVDKFVKEQEDILKSIVYTEITVSNIDEQTSEKWLAFLRGANYVLEQLKDSSEILEVTEIAKDVTYPRGCDEVDIDCNDCEHHRSTQWCARAIKNMKEANPAYEEGWMDGVDAAAKSLDGYTSGYADGWDDGWKECLESIRISMKKVLEDNK